MSIGILQPAPRSAERVRLVGTGRMSGGVSSNWGAEPLAVGSFGEILASVPTRNRSVQRVEANQQMLFLGKRLGVLRRESGKPPELWTGDSAPSFI